MLLSLLASIIIGVCHKPGMACFQSHLSHACISSTMWADLKFMKQVLRKICFWDDAKYIFIVYTQVQLVIVCVVLYLYLLSLYLLHSVSNKIAVMRTRPFASKVLSLFLGLF